MFQYLLLTVVKTLKLCEKLSFSVEMPKFNENKKGILSAQYLNFSLNFLVQLEWNLL